jgi:hypothetical protein
MRNDTFCSSSSQLILPPVAFVAVLVLYKALSLLDTDCLILLTLTVCRSRSDHATNSIHPDRTR